MLIGAMMRGVVVFCQSFLREEGKKIKFLRERLEISRSFFLCKYKSLFYNKWYNSSKYEGGVNLARSIVVTKNDINIKELFNTNKEIVFGELKNCFKVTVGKKISTIDIEEGLMYIWMFYYKNLVKDNPQMGSRAIYALVTDFDQLIKKDSRFLYNGDTRSLEIKTDFTNRWMQQNIIDMAEFIFQDKIKAEADFNSMKKNTQGKYKGIVRINTK